jgi:S1-C subfamily serine protease
MPVLQEQIARFRPGNTVKVDYFRNGKRYQTDVTLKNMNGTTALVSSALDNALLEEIGFEIRDLTEEEIKRLGTKGAKVVSIYRGSKIERTNMDPDFIITRINQKNIRTAEDVAAILSDAEGKVMLEGVYEGYPDVWYYEFPK